MTTYTSQPNETDGFDTIIYDQTPTTGYPTADNMQVGESNGGADILRCPIKFDLSSIPSNATIISATLSLWLKQNASITASNTHTLGVYRLKRAWVEGEATWNIYSTGNNWQTAGAGGVNDRETTNIGNSPTVATSVTAGTQVDVVLDPASIEEITKGVFTNNGWLLKSTAENNDLIYYKSSSHADTTNRPKLVIEYTTDNVVLRPNGAGATQGWDAEGGDWQRVDESSSDGDTTRLYTPTDNKVATFALENHTTQKGTISSINVFINTKGVDPISNSVQLAVRVSGTDYFSSTKTYNNTSYHYESASWATNPATSAAWTWSEIDALEAGMKRITGGGQAVTQVWIEVVYTPATIEQEGFRFRNDNGSETTATWLANQDTNVTQPHSTNTRLRMLLNTTNMIGSEPYQLEFKEKVSGSYAKVKTGALEYLLNETFASSLGAMTAAAGTWGVSGGVCQCTAGSAAWQNKVLLSNTTSFTDFEILVKVKKPSFNTQVIFRSGTGTNSGYGIQLRDTNVFRLENWGTSNLQQATPITWSTGTWYWVKILVSGTNKKAKVWADGDSEPGTWAIDYTGSEFSSGGIGFSAEGTGTSEYDDLQVYVDGTVIHMGASSNITASGENTTYQLTAPSGKSTSDFDAGRMQDDENPSDAVTISDSDYTEMEWCLYAESSTNGNTYQFRVTIGGNVIETYTVTPEWLVGTVGTADNSSRSAKLTGKDTSNSSRSAKLTGKDTSNDSRSAKTTGKDTSNDSRSAKIHGKDTTNDSRLAKVTGKDTSNDSRSSKLTGKDSSNDSRSAKVSGIDTTNDSRSAKTTGKDTSNDSRLAKLHGKDSSNSDRSAKITGKDSSNDSRSSKITGKDTSNDSRSAKITGKDTSSDSRSAKLTGGDSSNSERSAKLTGALTVAALVVAGGGGGGADAAGGGGGGGVKYNPALVVTPQSYTVTVGAGGATTGSINTTGSNGGNSVFSSITAVGGGGGGSKNSAGAVGANGGGGGHISNAGGTGSDGYNGGTAGTQSGGGGGGAGANGSNGSGGTAGDGGNGTANSISGSSVTYGGGGGGGSYSGSGGNGGTGGGGHGGNSAGATSTVGTNGLGGGGGGCGASNDNGKAGGSGVVIIRYLTSIMPTCTGGTITTDGLYTVHTFTSSGTFSMTGTPDNSSRSAKITGKDTSNSSRSSKLTGKDTSNDSRSAKLTGGDSGNSSRSAKVTGKDTSNSSRSAKTTGKDTDNSSRSAKITGKDTSNSSRSAKIIGGIQESSSRSAKITGINSWVREATTTSSWSKNATVTSEWTRNTTTESDWVREPLTEIS